MNSTVRHPFLSQKADAINFLAENICLNFLGLFGEYVCIHCLEYSSVSTFTNETHVSPALTHMMLLRNSPPFLWYHSKKVKAEAILCFLWTIVSIFGTHLVQNLS
jgi:hypothetical protein